MFMLVTTKRHAQPQTWHGPGSADIPEHCSLTPFMLNELTMMINSYTEVLKKKQKTAIYMYILTTNNVELHILIFIPMF